ncbi:MAG: hypothetical protein LBR88_07160 [Zoogloeaceae bacterium]|jgi:hypothetical protein|nr:hypothetical protein [Zoogloeaceae bacterium]
MKQPTDDLPHALSGLERLLAREASWINEQAQSPATRSLNETHHKLLEYFRAVGKNENLSAIVAAEKAIVQNELGHHANSKGMVSSLNAALAELTVTERLLSIIDDKREYSQVDQSHLLPKNREKGLPLDEARQAFKSHYARLSNLDKARLSEDEKAIIEARRDNMREAGKIYARRQARTLGVSED